MRVISQNGTIDVPYEQVVIQRFNRVIYFLNKNLTGVESVTNDMEMASYSTEEKAKKAMEMLRTAYTGRFITNTEVSQDFEKEMKELMKGGFGTVMVRDSGSRVEFNNLNGYFQFPTEEELEYPMDNLTTYTADDEAPSCGRCEHINDSDEWCMQNCGGTNGWSGYLRYGESEVTKD